MRGIQKMDYIVGGRIRTLYVCKLSTTQASTASRPTGIVMLCIGSPNFGISINIYGKLSDGKNCGNKQDIIYNNNKKKMVRCVTKVLF